MGVIPITTDFLQEWFGEKGPIVSTVKTYIPDCYLTIFYEEKTAEVAHIIRGTLSQEPVKVKKKKKKSINVIQ